MSGKVGNPIFDLSVGYFRISVVFEGCTRYPTSQNETLGGLDLFLISEEMARPSLGHRLFFRVYDRLSLEAKIWYQHFGTQFILMGAMASCQAGAPVVKRGACELMCLSIFAPLVSSDG